MLAPAPCHPHRPAAAALPGARASCRRSGRLAFATHARRCAQICRFIDRFADARIEATPLPFFDAISFRRFPLLFLPPPRPTLPAIFRILPSPLETPILPSSLPRPVTFSLLFHIITFHASLRCLITSYTIIILLPTMPMPYYVSAAA